MARALLRSAAECDEVMAGLQLFSDHIPACEPDISACIEELLEISTEFRELDAEILSLQVVDPDYRSHFKTLLEDVSLNLRSLQYNIQHVRRMFGETRHEKYSGARPYRRAWEDLDEYFRESQRGPSLLSRLETTNVFLQNVLAALRKYAIIFPPDLLSNQQLITSSEPVEIADIVRDRKRILELLRRQEQPVEQTFPGMLVIPSLSRIHTQTNQVSKRIGLGDIRCLTFARATIPHLGVPGLTIRTGSYGRLLQNHPIPTTGPHYRPLCPILPIRPSRPSTRGPVPPQQVVPRYPTGVQRSTMGSSAPLSLKLQEKLPCALGRQSFPVSWIGWLLNPS